MYEYNIPVSALVQRTGSQNKQQSSVEAIYGYEYHLNKTALLSRVQVSEVLAALSRRREAPGRPEGLDECRLI